MSKSAEYSGVKLVKAPENTNGRPSAVLYTNATDSSNPLVMIRSAIVAAIASTAAVPSPFLVQIKEGPNIALAWIYKHRISPKVM